MSLYPSLEDMKVDQMSQAQQRYEAAVQQPAIAAAPPAYGAAVDPASGASTPSGLYPSLMEYMGLELPPQMVQEHMAVVAQNTQIARPTPTGQMQVAPVTGNDVGLIRSEIKQGVREVIVCKGQDGKIGLRVRDVNKGVFIAFVHVNSPAALAGLRFGDQILQINGENMAGVSMDKCMKILQKANPERIVLAIRDRPFERTITLQKDSTGHVGFVFKENKITALVKDSSAARNGLLIDHHMVEVNGQNVVGLKEAEIKKVFENCGLTVTITIIPSFIYDHIIKSIGSSLIKKKMDHSIPDI